jgi:putative FmdB family regulatory protein
MPTYHYKCSNCGSEIEIFQKITDDKLTHCDACHQDSLERIIMATNFVLKGGGWFKDGYSNSFKNSNK